METTPVLEKAFGLLNRYKIAAVLGLAGLLLVGLGFLLPNLKSEKKPIVIENSKAEAVVGLKVDIEGAVKTPGVYTLNEGSRIADAISTAGGFTEKTDSVWLTKNINLASLIKDGDKIYINSIGEGVAAGGTQTLGTTTKKININNATATELDTLPGIGQVTANKIIAQRPYKDVSDLLTKKVVGQSTYNKIKDLVSAQ